MDAIIGYLVALTLSLLGIIGFTTWAKSTTTNVQTALTASQMVVFDKGALLFVEDNEQFLLDNATSTKAYVVTASRLISGDTGAGRSGATGGYLPPSFTATNVFGQTWTLYVVQPNKGILQALTIAQGGNMISDQLQLMQIAAQAGTQGGFVPVYPNSSESRNLNIDQNMTPDTAYGASSGWKVKLQGSGTDIPYPGNGHLVSLLSFTPRHFTNDNYLHRMPQAPSGHPQLNQMQADVGMTDTAHNPHQVYGASAYETSDGGGLSTTAGGTLALGAAQKGTVAPAVNFHLGGSPAQPFNVQIINDDEGHLQINSAGNNASLQVQGTLQTGSVATEGAPCAKTGLIATDVPGVLYSCVQGVWSKPTTRQVDAVLAKQGDMVKALDCPKQGATLMVRASMLEQDMSGRIAPLMATSWMNSSGAASGTNVGALTVIPYGGQVQIAFSDLGPALDTRNVALLLICSPPVSP